MAFTQEKIPHWDLSTVYPELLSEDFKQAMEVVNSLNDALELYPVENNINRSSALELDSNISQLSEKMTGVIDQLNEIFRLVNTLYN